MADTNTLDMFKQARDLQQRMKKVQKRVEKVEITADAGGGMVRVTMSGKLEVKRVEIESTLVAAGDVRMIEDLVAAAVNQVLKKAQTFMADEMNRATGGLNIPGLG
ncbi:MAG: YbaB/EbfC family nucleoid-associated protein [Deltaproteobacteria bacterium]|jgi:DNA-binding YbaB/EbfC family protein